MSVASPIDLRRTVQTYRVPPTNTPEREAEEARQGDTAVPLENLIGARVCLLIGEPGSGKSHSLSHLRQQILELDPRANPVLEDLREHNLHSLDKDLFDVVLSGESRPTQLLLDSLDECRARVDRFVPLLERRLSRAVASGIHVIATCRTSELSSGILQVFTKLGGESCIYQLVPLSDEAISEYFELSGLDGNESMDWLNSKGMLTLARIPSALRLLRQAAVEKPEMISDAKALYAYTLQRALEDGDARNSNGEQHDLSPRVRILAAERTAGLSVLAGISDIWLGETSPEAAALPIHDLIGEESDGPFTEFVGLPAFRAVLQTELFAQSGASQRRFLHRSIGTYLAARWLVRRRLSGPQLRTLLCGTLTGRTLVPPLREVGSWLVALDPITYRWIAQGDPLTLTRAKQVPDDIEVRRIIVDSLLDQSLDVYFRLSWNDTLLDLQHPQLSSQLEPHVPKLDRQGYVALRILRDSYVSGLNHILLDVTLDNGQPPLHRTIAFEILKESGDETRLAKILAATRDGVDEDRELDLLGHILDYAWPEHLSISDLWSRLRKPREAYVGSYAMFISHELVPRMTQDDRVWFVNQLVASWNVGAEEWDWLIEDDRLMRALGTGLVDPPSPESIEAAVNLSLLLLEQKHARVFPVAVEDTEAKRRLVEGMLNASSDADYLAARLGLAWDPSDARLVTKEDFEWALRKAIAPETAKANAFARLAATLFDPEQEEHRVALMDASTAPVWDRLKHLVDPNFWEERREKQEPLPDPEPVIEHDSFIETFDSHMDAAEREADAFWYPIRTLDVDFTRGYHSSATEVDLRKTAGYRALDETRQNAVLAVARRLTADPDRAKLPHATKPNTIYYALESAYRLLYLLEAIDDPAIAAMSPESWGHLAEAALVYPAHYANKDADRATKRRLLSRISIEAPDSLAVALRRALDVADSVKERYWPLGDLDLALAPPVVEVLRDELVKRRKPNLEGSLNLLFSIADRDAEIWCDRQIGRAKDVAIITSVVSASLAASLDVALDRLARLRERDPVLAESVTLALAGSYRTREVPLTTSAESLATAYEWLYAAFPPDQDPEQEGMVHWVGPREEVANWRDSFLRTLTEQGTPSSLAALERLSVNNPTMPLAWGLSRSRELVLQSSWDPPTVSNLLQLIQSDERRLINGPADLRTVVLEQLHVLQGWLVGENPQAFALWNVSKAPGAPKEENSVSDWYCHSLRLLLERRNIIVNREVEVRRTPGAPSGQRQDLRVETVGPGQDHWTVVVEVKGCWNGGLHTDLEGQLAARYLAEGGLTHGIYLVACFPSNQIRDAATQRKLRRHTPKQLYDSLTMRADAIDPRLSITVVVHQVPLPPQHLDTED